MYRSMFHRRAFASVGPVAHLLGAEAVHLEYPTQVVFESVTLGVNDGRPHRHCGTKRRRQVQPAAAADRSAATRLGPGHPPQRIAGQRAEPGRHPGPRPQRRLDTGRRSARASVGRRPAGPRRGRRSGLRYRLGCNDFHPQRRPTTPGAAGPAADRRMGRHRPGRAHQPPRHRRHHLAGRASATTLDRATPAACWW